MKFPRHLSLAIVAALLGASPALAADLSPRVYTKAPAYVDPGYNWTGFYAGLNLGYSWGTARDTSTLSNGAGTVLFTGADRANLDGIVGGGQIGYNWQMQNWVWGLEADIQGTGEKGTHNYLCPTGVCTPTTFIIGALVFPIPGAAVPFTLSQKIDWFGTVRGRVGILATPRVLFYATGGLAYGDVNSSETIGAPGGLASNSSTKVGYTVGAGVEGVISGNWTAKLEYLYVDLGRVNGTFATTIAAFGGGTIASATSSRVTDNVLRVGINYKFGAY